ncbi:NUDIX hydrolase [Paenibacillus tarimensis]
MTSAYLSQLPTLSHVMDQNPIRSKFVLDTTFDESLVSNISIVPTVGEQYVVIGLENGKWELAGGTLEPGEHYMEGLKREVMEELGAELVSFTLFGQFQCTSSASKPYRPHIPHPNFIRLLGCGEVKIVGKPLNPPDGEQVVSVDIVDIQEAIERYLSIDRPDIAEMYQLAHHLRFFRT